MLNVAVMCVVWIQLPVIIHVIIPNTKIPVILQVALLIRLLNLVSNFHPLCTRICSFQHWCTQLYQLHTCGRMLCRRRLPP